MRDRALSAALIVFVLLAIANFLLVVSANPPGSALGGGQEGDRYYVRNHTELIEVDRATWEFRRAQELVLLITFPVAVFVVKFGRGRRA